VVLCGSRGLVVVVVVVVGSGAVVLGVLGESGDGGNRGGDSLGISVLSVGIGRLVKDDIGVGYSWSSGGM